jgi:hypothetical protein
MVWREIVHFLQARSTLIPSERGAAMAGAVNSVWVAEGAGAHGVAAKSLQAREVGG